jgi:hypothetical protein
MKTDRRREAALELLASAGIQRSDYEPPLLRLLWRFGLNVPPPHFAPFWGNALVSGTFFGVFWGLSMWCLQWWRWGLGPAAAFAAAALAGLLFGTAMALRYAYSRRKYGLPAWDEISAQPRDRSLAE